MSISTLLHLIHLTRNDTGRNPFHRTANEGSETLTPQKGWVLFRGRTTVQIQVCLTAESLPFGGDKVGKCLQSIKVAPETWSQRRLAGEAVVERFHCEEGQGYAEHTVWWRNMELSVRGCWMGFNMSEELRFSKILPCSLYPRFNRKRLLFLNSKECKTLCSKDKCPEESSLPNSMQQLCQQLGRERKNKTLINISILAQQQKQMYKGSKNTELHPFQMPACPLLESLPAWSCGRKKKSPQFCIVNGSMQGWFVDKQIKAG